LVRGAEARIDVPAGIARLVRVREADGKRAEVAALNPAAGSDERIEREVQRARVSGLNDRRHRVETETSDGLVASQRIVRIATRVAPQDRPGLVGQPSRERALDLHVAALDERVDVVARQTGRGELVGG